MKNGRLIKFLRGAAPFAITLFLWRLGAAWLNPGGMLALIPIFFCTFIRPVPWFAPFGAAMCFLVDYNCNTILYWTSVFCACYAANGIQSVVDLTQARARGAVSFAVLFGLSVIILGAGHVNSITGALTGLWTIAWVCAMYIPITAIIERTRHD